MFSAALLDLEKVVVFSTVGHDPQSVAVDPKPGVAFGLFFEVPKYLLCMGRIAQFWFEGADP